MRELGITGVVCGKAKSTTIPGDSVGERPRDVFDRDFSAGAPNRRCADITYVATWTGFVYVAFVSAAQPPHRWSGRTGPALKPRRFDAARPCLSLGADLVLDRSDDPEEALRVYTDPDGHPFCIFVVAG
jgi:hypothetical protein